MNFNRPHYPTYLLQTCDLVRTSETIFWAYLATARGLIFEFTYCTFLYTLTRFKISKFSFCAERWRWKCIITCLLEFTAVRTYNVAYNTYSSYIIWKFSWRTLVYAYPFIFSSYIHKKSSCACEIFLTIIWRIAFWAWRISTFLTNTEVCVF